MTLKIEPNTCILRLILISIGGLHLRTVYRSAVSAQSATAVTAEESKVADWSEKLMSDLQCLIVSSSTYSSTALELKYLMSAPLISAVASEARVG